MDLFCNSLKLLYKLQVNGFIHVLFFVSEFTFNFPFNFFNVFVFSLLLERYK